MTNWKRMLKKVWFFIWEDDSALSWLVNVILAFIIVKFLIYPLLGVILSTSYPIVAVVSGSMEHNGHAFDEWWDQNREWYVQNGLDEELIKKKFKNGFNKGDIMILKGTKPENVEPGMVLVYQIDRYKYPIIHRVTKVSQISDKFVYQTKGDNNDRPDPDPVQQEKILGRAVIKIPWLGWVKIIFTNIFAKFIGG